MDLMLFDSTCIFAFFTCLIFRVFAYEDDRPEVFLPPRNFNPHPYRNEYDSKIPQYIHQTFQPLVTNNIDAYQQQGYRISGTYFNQNTGPVLFPANPEEPVVTSKPVVDRLKEIHPYAAVVKKKKYKESQIRNFLHEDSKRFNSPAYKALANQGAKVLALPHQLVTGQLPAIHPVQHNNDITLSDQKKNYEFSYKVENHDTGDDFSHIQAQNSQATSGQYRVRLPDGRVQVVSYTADHNGYNAQVTYELDKDRHGLIQRDEQVVVQSADVGTSGYSNDGKINVLAPVADYDYQLYDQPTHPQGNNIPLYEETYPVYNQQSQLTHSTYYNRQQPFLVASTHKHNVAAQVAATPSRVQIYATGLVGSTVAPHVQEDFKNNPLTHQVRGNALLSTVAPSAKIPIYLTGNVGYSTVAPQINLEHGNTALYVDRNTGIKYRLDLGKKK